MNVAIISPEFPPITNLGGIATFNFNLAKLLTSLKHKVFVFTLHEGLKAQKIVKKEKRTIVYVPRNFGKKWLNFLYFLFPLGIPRKLIEKYFPTTLFSFEWNLFCFMAFLQYQREFNIELIHTPIYHSPAFLTSLFFRKIPLVVHAQGPQELLNKYEPQNIDSKLKACVEIVYMKLFPTKIVACSENVKQHILEKFSQLRRRVEHIPNFIDYSLYKTKIDKHTLSISRIIFLGRLENRKGPDIVIKTFLRNAVTFPKTKLIFIGHDPKSWLDKKNNKVNFKTWIKEIDDYEPFRNRIEFVGRIDDRKKLIAYLKNNRGVAVLPSRYEPFGFVYLEAMATGNILIASSAGGGSEIVKEGVDGFVSNPTLESIDRKLKKVLSLDSKRIHDISQSAILKTKSYDIESVAPNYEKLYESIFMTR